MLSERSPFPSSDKEEQGKPTLPGLDCFSDEQSQEQPWLQFWEGTSLPEREQSPEQAATGHSSQAMGGWLQQTGRQGAKISNEERQ